jgi:hypothetical protein
MKTSLAGDMNPRFSNWMFLLASCSLSTLSAALQVALKYVEAFPLMVIAGVYDK